MQRTNIRTSSRGIGQGTVFAFIIFVLLAVFASKCMYAISTVTTRTFTVKRLEQVAGRKGKYLIFTVKGQVFENTDSFFHGKWNSSTLYGKLTKGKQYTCRVYGWRVPFLSWYPNLLSCEG